MVLILESVEENAYGLSHYHIINTKQAELYLWAPNSATPEFNWKIFREDNFRKDYACQSHAMRLCMVGLPCFDGSPTMLPRKQDLNQLMETLGNAGKPVMSIDKICAEDHVIAPFAHDSIASLVA